MYQATIILKDIEDVKRFVSMSMDCKFEVELNYERHIVNAKSIIGVLSLPLSQELELKTGCSESDEFINKIERFLVK